MTVQGLMTQAATLRKLTGETRGPTGESTPTYDESPILGYFEPDAPIGLEGEDLNQRNTQLGRWFGVVPADTELAGFDSLLYGELVMDLTGPPRPIWNPRLSAVSHIELSLRVVS